METEVLENAASRWELGSEFSWCPIPDQPSLTWPKEASWYMLARHAVGATVRMHSQFLPKLWLPSYFCPDVAECCEKYCEIREYRDNPRWPEPDWSSLRPTTKDFVLAVNYFGVRDATPWLQWRKNNNCFLLEDHSQDPFSVWRLTSMADYAFVSVRKTLPIPDGALLWSPRGLPLPEEPPKEGGDWAGSALKMAAMLCKQTYLQGRGSPELKPYFRNLQFEGEQRLRSSRISSISPYSYAYAANGIPESWRQQRLDNAQHLRERVAALPCTSLLFHNWPAGFVPFALPLVFGSTEDRDACQAHLQCNRIYCPVHWSCRTSDAEALDLSHRILSLPVDQRYGRPEMDRLADVLLGFLGNKQTEDCHREAFAPLVSQETPRA